MNQRACSSSDIWGEGNAQYTRAAELPPATWPNREHSRIVDVGSRWHVQRSGTGPGILLVHGTGSSAHAWQGVFEGLSATHDVLALDLPGHGFSSPLPSGRMRLDGISSALAALLQHIEFKPEIIVGHSAGAAIALQMSLHELQQPAAVIGINAALQPFGGSLAGLFAPLAKTMTLLPLLPRVIAHRARDEAVVRRMLESTGSRLPAEKVDWYRQLLCRSGHVAATLRMMADWNLRTLLDEIGPIAAHTYLVVGTADQAVPPSQAAVVRQRYPALSVHELDGLGHLANEERPDLILNYIAAVERQESTGDH